MVSGSDKTQIHGGAPEINVKIELYSYSLQTSLAIIILT